VGALCNQGLESVASSMKSGTRHLQRERWSVWGQTALLFPLSHPHISLLALGRTVQVGGMRRKGPGLRAQRPLLE
jgi:hypothetical protein